MKAEQPKRQFVRVDTEDGQITVEVCPKCGLLAPDLEPFHAQWCAELCEAAR